MRVLSHLNLCGRVDCTLSYLLDLLILSVCQERAAVTAHDRRAVALPLPPRGSQVLDKLISRYADKLTR
jgi:hypothetical protein